MNAPELKPIPIPPAQRLRQFKMTFLPGLVFLSALVLVGWIWKGRVNAPMMVGQADGVVSNVSSHQAGVVAGLRVGRFQKVHAGELLASVLIADPKLVEASLAVIRSEIETMRADLLPVIPQKRYAVDYAQLRLDWMRQRADLAVAKVNLQLADVELWRNEELFKDKLVPESTRDFAKTTRNALKDQVDELNRLVAEGEATFKSLSSNNPADAAQLKGDPLHTAIVAEETKLRLMEVQLSPVTLRAPIDGTVTAVYFRSGESITPGQPIVTIAADTPARIVGYLRQPIGVEPKPGATVLVRTRGIHRQTGTAQILEVGAQLDVLPPALQSSVKLTGMELVLPLNISLPAELKLRPGELVDISVIRNTE